MPDIDQVLIDYIRQAHLPAEEPISQWVAEGATGPGLKLRAHDRALLMCDGLVEYHVIPNGGVLVSDHRDPRSMRSQFYRPNDEQPFMHPSVEEDDLPRE